MELETSARAGGAASAAYGAAVEIGRGPSSVAERRRNPEVAGSIPVVCAIG